MSDTPDDGGTYKTAGPVHDPDGPVQLADLAQLPGCEVITDPDLIRHALWSSDRPGDGAPIIGDGEAWNYDAVQAYWDGTLAGLLAIDGISWQPGATEAALPPGMTTVVAASTWRDACDHLGIILDAMATQVMKGRPAGGAVRSPAAPGARWVTALPDGQDQHAGDTAPEAQ